MSVDTRLTSTPVQTRVVRFRTLDQLEALAGDWDRLSNGVPFRSWAWASRWWRHYGEQESGTRREPSLYVLGVFNRAGRVVGIAPWFVGNSVAEGRVVRFLGSGEVCSDYLSVLCEPAMEAMVCGTLAEWLTNTHAAKADHPAAGNPDRWDLLELIGVDAEDSTVGRLAEELEARGNTVHRRPGMDCWRIALPASWDAYLARLSKDHRKQVRRSLRGILASGRVTVHRVERLSDLARAQGVLIDLHQRRWRSRGEAGCYGSTRFTAFHRTVMQDLLRAGQLHLRWLDLDGEPIAAEYWVAGGRVIYAYQAGVNPDALEHSPGHLSHIVMIREAIEQGYQAIDFLRGDEPYKAHWRATPRPSVEIRVVPARPAAHLRHGLWLAGMGMKEWIKTALDGLKRGASRLDPR